MTQEPSEEKKHDDHICRFNDGDQSCDCYNEAMDKVKSKIPFLRQMINERKEGWTFTTEDLGFMLGLNTMKEVEEARRREKEIMNEVKKHL